MTTLERIRDGFFTQAEEEANLGLCEAIEEIARVYGVNAEGLSYSIWDTAQSSIEDMLGEIEASHEK